MKSFSEISSLYIFMSYFCLEKILLVQFPKIKSLTLHLHSLTFCSLASSPHKFSDRLISPSCFSGEGKDSTFILIFGFSDSFYVFGFSILSGCCFLLYSNHFLFHVQSETRKLRFDEIGI